MEEKVCTYFLIRKPKIFIYANLIDVFFSFTVFSTGYFYTHLTCVRMYHIRCLLIILITLNGIYGYRITDKKPQDVYLDMDKAPALIGILPSNPKGKNTLLIDFLNEHDKSSNKVYLDFVEVNGKYAPLLSNFFLNFVIKFNQLFLVMNREYEITIKHPLEFNEKLKLNLDNENIGFTVNPNEKKAFFDPKSHSRKFNDKKNIWKLQLSTSSSTTQFDVNFVSFYN